MSDEAALLHAIHANPDDDTPRLVYADWLDENGQPERAEFIRLQVRLDAIPSWNDERERIRGRESELLRAHRAAGAAELGIFDLEKFDIRFERGFLEVLFCTRVSAAELKLLRRMPELRLLVLDRCETPLEVLGLVANLRHLEVFVYGTNTVTDAELAVLDRLPCRTVIRTERGACSPEVWSAFLERRQDRVSILPLEQRREALKWLRHFNTTWPRPNQPARQVEFGTWGVFDAELRLLAAFPEVEEVSIGESSVTAAGLRHLAQLPKLKSLALACSPIDSITPLAECPMLESLELSFELFFAASAMLTDAGTVGLERITSLRRLVLKGCELADGTIARLVPLRQLRELELNVRLTGNEGCLVALAGLTELESLKLVGDISERALRHIARLPNLTSLEHNSKKYTGVKLRRFLKSLG